MQRDTPENSSVKNHYCRSLYFNNVGPVHKEIPVFCPSPMPFTALNTNINWDMFFENYKPLGPLKGANNQPDNQITDHLIEFSLSQILTTT
jgi:hypothetical protein